MRTPQVIHVVFKKDKRDGEIVAILPNIPHTRKVPLYAHNGQHSSCDFGWLLTGVVCASKEEYSPLLDELREVYRGHTLKVMKRLPSYRKI